MGTKKCIIRYHKYHMNSHESRELYISTAGELRNRMLQVVGWSAIR